MTKVQITKSSPIFSRIFVDPQLVHEAEHFQWDSATQTMLTPGELATNETSIALEEQGWWKDVVEQFEEKKRTSPGKRAYASEQALFDFDGVLSIKTMHEDNDVVSHPDTTSGSKHIHITEGQATEIMDIELVPNEGRSRRRQCHRPKSVEVQIAPEDEDRSGSEADSSDQADSAQSMASAAIQVHELSGASG